MIAEQKSASEDEGLSNMSQTVPRETQEMELDRRKACASYSSEAAVSG